MIRMNLHQIGAIVGGSLVGKEARIHGVCTDSRQIEKGQLFVALKGEHFNGEDYVMQAVDRGAAAVLVSQAVEVPVPQLIVDDALEALSALAKAWLNQCDVKVLAITGSNGKTSVKNMLHSILSQSHACFATPGNLNNEIGVPLSLLRLKESDEFAVIEMGAAQIGDIAYLTDIAPPDVALVNNVSNAHVGRFGSVENIAIGKGEIYQALNQNGVAVINADDDFSSMWLENHTAQLMSFGSSSDCDVQVQAQKGASFGLTVAGENWPCELPVLGDHNQYNAAAAATMAMAVGVGKDDVIKGLASFEPAPGRLQVVGQVKEVTLINDTYNANLASSQAAIDVLAEMPEPRILVMGDMAELGEYSISMHQKVGAYAEAKGIDRVLAVGDMAAHVCEKKNQGCQAFIDVESVIGALQQSWPVSGTVLVKGSRGMRMERVVEAMVNPEVEVRS